MHKTYIWHWQENRAVEVESLEIKSNLTDRTITVAIRSKEVGNHTFHFQVCGLSDEKIKENAEKVTRDYLKPKSPGELELFINSKGRNRKGKCCFMIKQYNETYENRFVLHLEYYGSYISADSLPLSYERRKGRKK